MQPDPAQTPELVPSLITESSTKIVLVVMDGLGGLRTDDRGSELTAANSPNLDLLASEGSSGLQTLVAPGITPGSGAGHLALFGYDPLIYELGRGALSAAGVGFELTDQDVAARVNFCTIDGEGRITDRRAGRISTEENERLCQMLKASIDLGGRAEVFFVTEKDHRALLVLRGQRLSSAIADTDPQVTGVPPNQPLAVSPEAGPTADLFSEVLLQAGEALKLQRANFILLRGFDSLRELPYFQNRYRLNAAGIAGYPMYVGIARILGMDVFEEPGGFAAETTVLSDRFEAFDYFYIHQKKTDSAGEDGDFDRKVAAIEEVDASIPEIVGLKPSVICVTGDHATPSQLRAHSWHPVPFVMWGPSVGIDSVKAFNEEAARSGAFGHILGKDLMPLMLAAAGRLLKFGA